MSTDALSLKRGDALFNRSLRNVGSYRQRRLLVQCAAQAPCLSFAESPDPLVHHPRRVGVLRGNAQDRKLGKEVKLGMLAQKVEHSSDIDVGVLRLPERGKVSNDFRRRLIPNADRVGDVQPESRHPGKFDGGSGSDERWLLE